MKTIHFEASGLRPYPSLLLAVVVLAYCPSVPAADTEIEAAANSKAAISSDPTDQTDAKMAARLRSIYGEIENLQALEVEVAQGVISVSGKVANEAQAQDALRLANRIEGAVTVEDNIERTLSVQENLTPVLTELRDTGREWLRASPLVLVALVLFAAIAYAGHRFASWRAFWRRLLPNPFLADLAGQAVRVLAVLFGLLLALNLLGATALIGTILGGAGVLGLAIGFAVRDSMENYIASIMLSLRQPFRADEHVIINDREGLVVRLTSRATILMTLDGNHLRIPNSVVFKGTILNYTRNPQRRFEFSLGVDADDDPGAAMQVGLDQLRKLDWVLQEPEPLSIIESVGDSNIIIKFMGWIDQRNTDFGKARSLAIRAVKIVLEDEGFTLPEPIYRLRFDSAAAVKAIDTAKAQPATETQRERPADHDQAERELEDQAHDLAPMDRLREMAEQDRTTATEEDLLDDSVPVE